MNAVEGVLDLADGVAFGLVVGQAEVGPHGLLDLLAIFGRRLAHLGQLAVEPLADQADPQRRQVVAGVAHRTGASPRSSLSRIRSLLTWLLTSAASGNSLTRQLKLFTRLR